jgi:hypothetical protein
MFTSLISAWGWLSGVGLPTIAGAAALAGAAYAWFRVPVIGQYMGLALCALGVGLLAYAGGYADARAACNDASLRTELAQARADLQAASNAEAQARELGARLNATEARNHELAHELANRPTSDACRAGDDDVGRLRNIR